MLSIAEFHLLKVVVECLVTEVEQQFLTMLLRLFSKQQTMTPLYTCTSQHSGSGTCLQVYTRIHIFKKEYVNSSMSGVALHMCSTDMHIHIKNYTSPFIYCTVNISYMQHHNS